MISGAHGQDILRVRDLFQYLFFSRSVFLHNPLASLQFAYFSFHSGEKGGVVLTENIFLGDWTTYTRYALFSQLKTGICKVGARRQAAFHVKTAVVQRFLQVERLCIYFALTGWVYLIHILC